MLSEINKDKLKTENDLYQDDDGQFKVAIEIPSTGDRFEVSGRDPNSLLESANEMILHDLKRVQAEGSYREGVKKLSDLCLSQDGSGAKAAAQVLLSCYNGSFHVDITDLCSLDENNFSHALAVINGRVICSAEPHDMVDNGNEIFERLWKRWEHLHSKFRYKDWYE